MGLRRTDFSTTWLPIPSGFLLADKNAYFWVLPYKADSSKEIIIQGRYPLCRYISFSAHTGANSITTAYDQIIMPDLGCTNPFLPNADFNATNRDYTLKISFTDPPDKNHPYTPSPENNTLYVGSSTTLPDNIGFIVYRLYVPSDKTNDTGGVGLPTVLIQDLTSRELHPITSINEVLLGFQIENSSILKNIELFHPPSMIQITQEEMPLGFNDLNWSIQPQGVVPVKSLLSVYIYTFIRNDPTMLLYIKWKTPTFPDTFHKKDISGTENMRYWGLSFGTLLNQTTHYSIADYEVTTLDNIAKVVVSFGASRPSFVTPENGFTWIDLSGLNPDLLIYRNSLSGGFPFTSSGLPESSPVGHSLGSYLPIGKYLPAKAIFHEDFS
ncbi:hypothetical protein [Dendrosporobacter sp. 1207_IL3150]|uniref:hypothetical protein n=1 Tax=Dendrosporobacter sp. 1207_IL3150 TaxID=3084054 RepID=UPI002FDA9AF2